MIHSVYIGDDVDLLARILPLHDRGPGSTILDATYGHGGFWRSGRRETDHKVVGLDIRMAEGVLDLTRCPPNIGLVAGDYESLPFPAETFDAVIYDPPFLTRGGDNSLMKSRYGTFKSYDDLLISMATACVEFRRVLKPKGIVVVKAMDWTEGRRRRWMHIDVVNSWSPRFRLDDLFVKVAVQNMRNAVWRHQDRSRAAHVYFLVFKSRGRSRSTAAREMGLS